MAEKPETDEERVAREKREAAKALHDHLMACAGLTPDE